MKSGPAAGAIGGLLGAIAGYILYPVGSMIGLFPPSQADLMMVLIKMLVTTIIFGIIFGFIYVKLFDCFPGKGIMKGLYFGLMIWLIKDITAGTYVYNMGFPIITAILVWVGFFMWVVYGLVIGYLYKK
jgi:hypothetical protein